MLDRAGRLLFSAFALAAIVVILLASYLQGRMGPRPETAAAAPATVVPVLSTSSPSPSPSPTLVPPTATSTPDPPATLRLAVPGLPDTLDPLATQNIPGQVVASLVFSGLTKPGMTGDLVPDLAESWTSVEGGATWEFKLSPSAQWHDGQPVTTSDVVYTIDRVKTTWLAGLWAGITVEAIDPSTLRFHVLPGRAGDLLPLTTLPILPAHLLNAGAQAADQWSRLPIGSGPFRLTHIDAQGAALERAHPLSPGGANVQTIQLLFTGSPKEALPAVRSGRADVAFLPVVDAATALATRGVTLWRPVRAAETMLLLNTRRAPFSDQRVRLAVSLALDRTALVQSAVGGLGVPTDQPLPAIGTPMPETQADVEQAGTLLDGAQWVLGPDGLRHRSPNGGPLAITILTTTDPTRLAVAQQLSTQLRRVGISAAVQRVGSDGLLRDFLAPGRFDAAVVGIAWALPTRIPQDWWRAPQGTPVPDNFGGVADATIEATLANAEANPDATSQATELSRFQSRFTSTYPAIPLYQPVWLLATNRNITNVAWGYLTGPGDLVRGVIYWRVEASSS